AIAGISSTGHVRPHVQTMPLSRSFQSRQLTSIRQIPNPACHARRRPSIGLEQVLDLTLDVEAPDALVRPESKRLEWDRQFRRPSFGRSRHGGVPDTVPVPAKALPVVRDLSVRPRPGGIPLKEESVAMIEAWIEHDRHAIVHIEISVPS